MALFTVGHSTLTEEAFLSLTDGISTIIDVRSHPTSKWPQHKKENLEKWLPAAGKNYELDQQEHLNG